MYDMKRTHSCTHCDYKSIQKGTLQIHIKSIHHGITFDCTQCDYKATTKGSLHRHIKSLHEGKHLIVHTVTTKQPNWAICRHT